MNDIYDLWGKCVVDERYHLLVYHMLDSAAVAKAYIEKTGKDKLFKDLLGVDNLDFLYLVVALHDIGKASWCFQNKKSEFYNNHFTKEYIDSKEKRHEIYSEKYLENTQWLDEYCSENIKSIFKSAIGGHHGVYNDPKSLNDDVLSECWITLVNNIISSLQKVICSSEPNYIKKELSNSEKNKLLVLSSGLISLSDWISSNDFYFGHQQEKECLMSYWNKTKVKAENVVELLKFSNNENKIDYTFDDIFDFPERSLQKVITSNNKKSKLIIIEAPTGEGKTEAALFESTKRDGLYYALPTTATSNQMFKRVCKFLEKSKNDKISNISLVHGRAFQLDMLQDMMIANQSYSSIPDDTDSKVVSIKWFQQSKRGLLSNTSVGTVDQTLLSTMIVKYFYLRLFGLCGKCVVFDEVHAYDYYMFTLFKSLLRWLRILDTTVIIMSATLTKQMRDEIVDIYSESSDVDYGDYPRVVCVDEDDNVSVKHFSSTFKKSFEVEVISCSIYDKLEESLSDGGTAAVICNTINDAVEQYKDLKQKYRGDNKTKIYLIHSKFTFGDREKIEEELLSTFSKNCSLAEGERRICVSTQIIEQSLDIDFDVMFSKLCPIDLLIQRAGRLHRHNKPRKEKVSVPKLYILEPTKNEKGEIIFSETHNINDGSIYKPYIMNRTWNKIKEISRISIPDNICYIDEIYANDKSDPNYNYYRASLDDSEKKCQPIILNPNKGGVYRKFTGGVHNSNDDVEETSSKIKDVLKANTREDPENSVDVICLHENDSGIYLDPDYKNKIDLNDVLTYKDMRRILEIMKSSASLQDKWFKDETPRSCDAWKKAPHLAYYKILIFKNGEYKMKKCSILFNKELGIFKG